MGAFLPHVATLWFDSCQSGSCDGDVEAELLQLGDETASLVPGSWRAGSSPARSSKALPVLRSAI